MSMDKDTLNFADDIQAAFIEKKTPFASAFLYIIIALIMTFFTWAYFAKVDEMTSGLGKIVPSSHVKKIQSLEGGIIQKILVREGQRIKPHQIIAQLDNTHFLSSLKESRAKMNGLAAKIARLTAEANGAEEINFPKDLPEALTERENSLFKSRQQSMKEALATLEKNYQLAKHELSITAPLVQEGIVSQVEVLRLERQVNEMAGEIQYKRDNFVEEAKTDLNKNQVELQALKESSVADVDRVNRTEVRSPVLGTVKKIYINTPGEVLKPGADIMEIVPLEDTLLVEAKIQPHDVGFIHPEQEVKIKISAYDFSIYGGLTGKIEHISADTLTDEEGNTYYQVLIRTDKNHLEHQGKKLPLMTGMTVTVHIITGEKSILDYLLKPLLKTKNNAFRER